MQQRQCNLEGAWDWIKLCLLLAFAVAFLSVYHKVQRGRVDSNGGKSSPWLGSAGPHGVCGNYSLEALSVNNSKEAVQWWPMPLISAHGRQRQVDLQSEF